MSPSSRSIVLLGLLGLLGACAEDGDDRSGAVVTSIGTAATTVGPGTAEPTSPTAAPRASDGPAATEPPATSAPPTEPPATEPPATEPPATSAPPTVGDPQIGAVELGRFEQPVDLVPRPGDDALYVVQQRGAVIRWVVDGDARATVLDLDGRLSTGNEQGLLGLAFAPDGSRAYVDFTDTDGRTTIAEYQVRDDGTFDTDSERVVLTVPQPYANHNAGDLAVDADGLLYVTLGDGGSGGDPQRVAHDPTVLLGSLLRIDPTPADGAAYSIPPDNPFAAGPLTLPDGTALEGAPEVFAWGLRNPWRIAFDPVTGELWIADVGQNAYEEVNVVGPTADHPAGWGHDFGWSAFEGTERYNADVPDTGRATPPVHVYAHGADGCSVSGGVPYRGTAIPELEPAFVYSDYCSGIVWAFDAAGGRNLVLLDGLTGVTTIRSDAAGELYVLQAGGAISLLVPS